MKKENFILIFFLSFTLNVFSQPGIEWQKTIGGIFADELVIIRQSTDGGYILGGSSNSDSSGNKTENSRGLTDYWVVKVDYLGNFLWDKTIGGGLSDDLFSMELTTDGGYILGGRSESNISGDKSENSRGLSDYWIVKLDSTGGIQWQRTFGGNDDDFLTTVEQTFDGGFILGGGSASHITGDKTVDTQGFWTLKLDTIGNIQWQNAYYGGASCIHQTFDAGYIWGGNSPLNSGDYWIIKTDSLDSLQWQKTFGGNDVDEIKSIVQTSDSGYIVGGSSFSSISGDKTEISRGLKDFWILKLNISGNIEWQKTIGGADHDHLNSIEQTPDGGYIAGGFSASNISGDKTENSKGFEDYWIVKFDMWGSILWQKTIGGSGDDELRSIQVTDDAGYIVGGSSLSGISGDKTEDVIGLSDYWAIKFSTDTGIKENNHLPGFMIYPNPITSFFSIYISGFKQYMLKIHNSIGGLVFQTMSSASRLQIDVRDFPSGIYFVSIIDEKDNIITQKFINLR